MCRAVQQTLVIRLSVETFQDVKRHVCGKVHTRARASAPNVKIRGYLPSDSHKTSRVLFS